MFSREIFCICSIGTFAMLFGYLLKCHLPRYFIHTIFTSEYTYINPLQIITYYEYINITLINISTYDKNTFVSVFS